MAVTRRRAEAVGRVADRLLALCEDAASSDRVAHHVDGVVEHPVVAERRAEVTKQRRGDALNVLMGKDALEAGVSMKTHPTSLIQHTLAVALQAVRLAQELGDKASGLDLDHAAAMASRVSRAAEEAKVDGKAAGIEKNRQRAHHMYGGNRDTGLRVPTHDGDERRDGPRLFTAQDDADPDARPDPLAHVLTLEAEMPVDLPDAIEAAAASTTTRGADEGSAPG